MPKRTTKLPKIYSRTEPTVIKMTTDEKILELLENASANIDPISKGWMHIRGAEQLEDAIKLLKDRMQRK